MMTFSAYCTTATTIMKNLPFSVHSRHLPVGEHTTHLNAMLPLPELQPSAGPSLSSDWEDEALLMWELDSGCVDSLSAILSRCTCFHFLLSVRHKNCADILFVLCIRYYRFLFPMFFLHGHTYIVHHYSFLYINCACST